MSEHEGFSSTSDLVEAGDHFTVWLELQVWRVFEGNLRGCNS